MSLSLGYVVALLLSVVLGARATGRTFPLNRQPFDIAALLEQVASRWRKETPWPQVCASSTTVWLDRDKVERIVQELLANTARHTPQDTVVL
jgi:signal transduction histidine kinase